MRSLAVILCAVALASCGSVSAEESVLRSVLGTLVNCNSDLSLCMKEHALKVAERFNAARKLKIFEGVTLLNNSPKEAKSLESLSADPSLRNKQVTERLWDSTSEILKSSELELSYGGLDEDETPESRAFETEVEEGRGKKKKAIKKTLKVLIPLILLAKAKAAAAIVVSFVIIAISLAKLAAIAKIAFIIKIIALIKELLAKKHAHEEVEWQPHGWESQAHSAHSVPVVEHGHGWEGGWSRGSKADANSMAYSAYGV